MGVEDRCEDEEASQEGAFPDRVLRDSERVTGRMARLSGSAHHGRVAPDDNADRGGPEGALTDRSGHGLRSRPRLGRSTAGQPAVPLTRPGARSDAAPPSSGATARDSATCETLAAEVLKISPQKLMASDGDHPTGRLCRDGTIPSRRRRYPHQHSSGDFPHSLRRSHPVQRQKILHSTTASEI